MGGRGAKFNFEIYNSRNTNEYKTPFSYPPKSENTNEIFRYNIRIGEFEGLPATNGKFIRFVDYPLENLSHSQETIRKNTIDYFVKNKIDPDKVDVNSAPFIIKNGDVSIIFDGHHRASYAKSIGRKTIKANVLDLSEIKSQLNKK